MQATSFRIRIHGANPKSATVSPYARSTMRRLTGTSLESGRTTTGSRFVKMSSMRKMAQCSAMGSRECTGNGYTYRPRSSTIHHMMHFDIDMSGSSLIKTFTIYATLPEKLSILQGHRSQHGDGILYLYPITTFNSRLHDFRALHENAPSL